MLKIQKNVRLPKIAHPTERAPRTTYPMKDMAVGDMFFVPNRPYAPVASHVSAAAKRLKRRFACRKLYMVLGARGWRVARETGRIPSYEAGAVLGVGVWRVK